MNAQSVTWKIVATPFALAAVVLFASSTPMLGSSSTPVDDATVASAVERGKYLVDAIGCEDCHTPLVMGADGPVRDPKHHLAGHPADMVLPAAPVLPPGPWAFTAAGTMTAWSGPWGTSFTANLTPDKETGLGSWTAEQFIETIRTQRHLGRGRPLLPPMPAIIYARLSDEDLRAIFAYLQSIPAVSNPVPLPLPPAE